MEKEKRKSKSVKSLLLSLLIVVVMGTFSANIGMAQAPIVISPSGDTTGVVDANNIENALMAVGPGGVVVLEEGHYYVSRSIIVEGFNGTIKGKGMDETIIEAVRQGPGPGEGFVREYLPGTTNLRSILLHLYSPTGLVIFKDLTLQVTDSNPCDPDGSGNTHMTHLFLFSMGNADIVVKNVNFLGAPGNYFGSNLAQGFLRAFGSGSVTFENSVVEHARWGCEVWRMEDASISIKGNIMSNCEYGLNIAAQYGTGSIVTGEIIENSFSNCWWGLRVDYFGIISSLKINGNSFSDIGNNGIGMYWNDVIHTAEISGNTIAVNPTVSTPLFVAPASNCTISRNTVSGGSDARSAIQLQWGINNTISGNIIKDHGISTGRPQIYLWDIHNSTVSNNTFDNVSGGVAGIKLAGGSSGNILQCNDYTLSGLPGWDPDGSGGPGCVLLDSATADNIVAECLFPEGTTVYNQVSDLGDSNQILTCLEGSVYLINKLISEIESLIEEGKINRGQGNSLIKKLEEAIRQINRGNNQPACNKLGDFIDEVNACIKSGKLSPEEGRSLIDMAKSVMICLCG